MTPEREQEIINFWRDHGYPAIAQNAAAAATWRRVRDPTRRDRIMFVMAP